MSLLRPEASAWRKVYESKNDQSFVTLTGFDWLSFHAMVPEFETHYTSTSPTTDANGMIILINHHHHHDHHFLMAREAFVKTLFVAAVLFGLI